ncbi:MAG: hypothetical protein WC794_02790 [Candidatus Doudnabacteria bacterium]|jgi:hypothetical protein
MGVEESKNYGIHSRKPSLDEVEGSSRPEEDVDWRSEHPLKGLELRKIGDYEPPRKIIRTKRRKRLEK